MNALLNLEVADRFGGVGRFVYVSRHNTVYQHTEYLPALLRLAKASTWQIDECLALANRVEPRGINRVAIRRVLVASRTEHDRTSRRDSFGAS